MYEDDPQEKVFDLLGEAMFGDDPLGRAIIGRAAVISDTPAAAIAGFHADRYSPSNVVIAAAGAVDHDQMVRAGHRPGPGAGAKRPSGARPGATRRAVRAVGSSARTPSSSTSASAATGLSRHDDRRFALRVLDTIFGGTSSSRLFQEVRERRGLAYAVYSFTSAYQDTGQVGLYVGTRAENLAQAMEVVGSELANCMRPEPATAEELHRAKENLKGRVVLALESTGARMNRLGSELLAGEDADGDRRARAADRRGHARRSGRAGTRAVGARAPVGGRHRPRSRSASRRRSRRSRRRSWRPPGDPRRGRRGRGADGSDRLRGRRRAPTTWSSSRGPIRRSAHRSPRR